MRIITFRAAKSAVLLAQSLLIPQNVSGQVSLLPTTELQESMSEIAEISNSGSIAKALVSRSLFESGAQKFMPNFELFVPEDGAVCISYITANDLYLGTRNYLSTGSGWVQVGYYSKNHSETLARFGSNAFVAAAWLASDCFDRSGVRTLLPTRSGNIDIGVGDEYVLVIHADDQPADIEVYPVGTRSAIARRPCQPIVGVQRISFDKVCPVPSEAFESAMTTIISVRAPGRLERTQVNLAQVPIK